MKYGGRFAKINDSLIRNDKLNALTILKTTSFKEKVNCATQTFAVLCAIAPMEEVVRIVASVSETGLHTQIAEYLHTYHHNQDSCKAAFNIEAAVLQWSPHSQS